MTTLDEPKTITSTESAKTSPAQVARLIVAAVLIGASGVLLVVTGGWVLNFTGTFSADLKGALGGHTLTSAGVTLLVFGMVLLACVLGILLGPSISQWIGLIARLVAIVVATVVAFSGIWLVQYYPGWAITYTVLGALGVYVLTWYERELPTTWPWAPLRAWLAQVFALNTKGLYVPRGVAITGLALITLVITTALHQDHYYLSVGFGLVFVTLTDPGGPYPSRLRRMAVVGAIGTLITALGWGIGGEAWGWIVLAVFVVTMLSGLSMNFGLQEFVAGTLLNVWLLITLSESAGLPPGAPTHAWNQALAWLIGSGIAVALMTVLWLLRGMPKGLSALPEVPADLPMKLSPPVVLFVVIRAIAISAAAAVAFGLNVTSADWMPIAALVAMKTTLDQSSLRSAQRLIGTALGAAIAATFLVTVTSHRALEEIVFLLLGIGASIYAVNYTFYATLIAGAVLIAMDLPHPTNLDAEGRRIFFTFVGIAIAIAVLAFATLIQTVEARAATPQQSAAAAQPA
jgi:heme exporter protein D